MKANITVFKYDENGVTEPKIVKADGSKTEVLDAINAVLKDGFKDDPKNNIQVCIRN